MPVLKFTFQSLIGFKINWNDRQLLYINSLVGFQSLIGFKINWNLGRVAVKLDRINCFNP